MAGKADVVDHVVSNVEGMTKKDAAAAFEAMVGAIVSHLRKGDRVQIPGLGSFSVGERAARTGRNPKTGQTIRIPASKNVRFKAGKDLKESVNK